MQHINGIVRGSVGINEETVIDGVVQASVVIWGPTTVTLRGKIQGSTSLGPGSQLVIIGAQEGSVTIAVGAEVTVEAGGRLAGSLHNDGRVVLRGVFGGAQSGCGTLEIQDRGWIKPPDEVRDGVHIYRW